MSKNDGAEYSTHLSTSDIKRVLSQVLDGATVETLHQGALDENADLAILARRVGGVVMQKSPYGPGLAAIQVIVTDRGDERRVEIIALGSSFSDGMNSARGSTNIFEASQKSKHNLPKLPMSKKMAASVVEGLRNAGGALRQVG